MNRKILYKRITVAILLACLSLLSHAQISERIQAKKIEAVNSLKFTPGNQAYGKFLRTDAAGNVFLSDIQKDSIAVQQNLLQIKQGLPYDSLLFKKELPHKFIATNSTGTDSARPTYRAIVLSDLPVTVAGNNYTNGLISVQNITLVDSTLTIFAPIAYRYQGNDYTISSNAIFAINKLTTGFYRTDLIYIDSLGVIRKIAGTADTIIANPPPMPLNGIQITNVFVSGNSITSGGAATSSTNWMLNGNNNTTGSSLLGTLNNSTVRLITNGLERASIDSVELFL